MARSTVREALRILEVNGLIVMRSGPKGGPIVARAGAVDFGRMMSLFLRSDRITIGEVLQTRRFLEPALLRDAVQRHDSDFVARVCDLKVRSKETDVRDERAYTKVTREFHELIVSAGSNRVLRLFGLGLMSLYAVPNRGAVFPVPDRGVVINEHDAIMRAIIRGNAHQAEKLMTEHMDHYCDSVQLTPAPRLRSADRIHLRPVGARSQGDANGNGAQQATGTGASR